MSNLLIVVQCRMASYRFPSKATALLLGQPLLLWTLDRLSRVTTPHDLVVACPNTPEDQAIRDLCLRHGYQCLLVPGEPKDVLARFHAVAQMYEDVDAIVRVCGDTPLVDGRVVDGLIAHYVTTGVDHVGIAAEWGDGMDCEIFSRTALETAMACAVTPSDREHVTPWMHRECLCATYPCPFDLSFLRLSVDTPYDLTLVETLLTTAIKLGYGLDLSLRDLLAVFHMFPGFKDQMAQRPINQAYVDQVAVERRDPTLTWQVIRYGSNP